MAKATVHSLSDKERGLVDETRPDRLRDLDEDALVELHTRVRAARNKHVGVHRRQVAKRVAEVGARGTVSVAKRRSASKAEIFEDALARVSASLAKAARRSAAELRAERLAAAKPAPRPVGPARSGATDGAPRRAERGAPRRAIDRKKVASTRAAGARRQAGRDAR